MQTVVSGSFIVVLIIVVVFVVVVVTAVFLGMSGDGMGQCSARDEIDTSPGCLFTVRFQQHRQVSENVMDVPDRSRCPYGERGPIEAIRTQPQGRAGGLATGSRASVEFAEKKRVLAARVVPAARRSAPPQGVKWLSSQHVAVWPCRR